MNIQARNLVKATEIAESTGLKVTYLFDDLIFVEHNAFLLRFNDENPGQIFIHFNKDCYLQETSRLKHIMEAKAREIGIQALQGLTYLMNPKEGTEELEIAFQP